MQPPVFIWGGAHLQVALLAVTTEETTGPVMEVWQQAQSHNLFCDALHD